MNTVEYLDSWLAEGKLTPAQHAAMSAVARRQRVSVFAELNVLLYLGVVTFAGGLAWTARAYSDTWGDAAILLPATALLIACIYYCVTRAAPFSTGKVAAQGFAFDYVLYLACLLFAVELGYVEYRFELLRAQWDNYLLASSVVYFAAAYRFDNRFVLSLALATLGGWFGVRLSYLGVFTRTGIAVPTLVYGLLVAGIGGWLYRVAVKRHFLDTYLHVAANAVLGALVAGSITGDARVLWLAGLVAVATASIVCGERARRFAFVVYGVGYGYVGVSAEWLRHISGDSARFTYVVVSAVSVVLGLLALSRRSGREG